MTAASVPVVTLAIPNSLVGLFLSRMQHVPRYVPARSNEGWSVALAVVALAVVCIVVATLVHKRTYKHPTDPTWHAAGSAH